ncbi:unnamed protein product [Rhizophagus irregularis]|nr:unnamed protein product [Rhizophagus irregularis]
MNKAFTKPMLDDIEWMCIHGHLKPLSIKRMLKAKYNRKIYNQDLYKVIYKHRKNNPQLGNNDVSQLFVYLETLKEKDPRWIIYKDWDHETNTLTRIFWMSPEQLETWHHYSDVILNDNTAKTNRETKDAYAWVLQCTLDATGITPKVFITDADPGMDAAILLKYPSTFPIHCIWHISQNLPLRLKSKLDLLVKYPNTASYLERSLYPSKKSWACAFNNNIFTIDIQTTSRCESVNATFKRLLFNSNSTLIDIFHAVQERLEEEEDNNDYINWKSSLPCNQSSTIASNAFTNIIDELKLFVTPQIQKVHYSEMEMAFNYDARVLDQSYIKNETSQDWSFADGFIENQEIRQITFHQLLSTCNQSSIKNLWGVNHLTSSGIHHLVILLKNGIYKCSCMSLVTRGIVCRHYFSIMLRTSQAQFHIGFINSRWFITTHLNDIKNRPLYSASKFNTNLETSLLESNNSLEFLDVIDDVSSTSISTPYVSFNKQRLYYANVYGLVKQANQIACKTCDESFIDLLKEYINKKNSEALTLEQSDNMENQDELEVDQENTNQIKLEIQ